MKTFFIVLLAGSLLANAWLLRRSVVARSETVLSAKDNQASLAPARRSPADAIPTLERIAKTLANPDVSVLRDALRSAGSDEATVRAVVSGVLRRRFDEQTSAWRIESIRTGWWLSPATRAATAPSRLTLVRDPLQAALGPDPLDLADAELRYQFLPPEKRRLLAKVDLDYADLRANAGSQGPRPMVTAYTKSESEVQELLMRERRSDMVASLNAEERAEYDLRFGNGVVNNVRRFSSMEASEPEFRAILPVISSLEEQTKTLRSGSPDYAAGRSELEQRAMDQLVATLGYERAVDYLWAVASGPYLPTVRLMKELQLPTSHAAQLLQLAAETGVKAAAIHRDDALSPEQKRAALAQLQVAARPQLDGLVPPASQPKLDPQAIAWFNALGEGRYAAHRTVVSGNGWIVATPISVTTPSRTPMQTIPLPRRSRN